MEVFCRNIPEQVSEKHVRKSFGSVLKTFNVQTFECRKLKRGCATLTIGDARKAQSFLDKYGDPPKGTFRTSKPLQLWGKSIYLSQSRNLPDELLLRSLREEEHAQHQKAPRLLVSETKNIKKSFPIVALACGLFDYSGSVPVFVRHFHAARSGNMVFGKNALKVSLQPIIADESLHHVEFDYYSMRDAIYLGNHQQPTVTLSLIISPRLYEAPQDSLTQLMRQMNIRNKSLPKIRISSLGKEHNVVAATCLVYQLTLNNGNDIQFFYALKYDRQIPQVLPWMTRSVSPSQPLSRQMSTFLSLLSSQSMPYDIKFQLQMLVWNGILPPMKVIALFKSVYQLFQRVGIAQAVRTIKQLAKEVQFAGPEADESAFAVETLIKSISEIDERVGMQGHFRDSQSLHPNRAMVHKAEITPLGTYLYGPLWESKNRVLRRYASHTDHFLRVEFSDESGDSIRFDPTASLDLIYNERFRGVLRDGLMVGGRQFEFLGFSHSSLRSQSCWFMAAFRTETGEHMDARSILRKLGDFSEIRIPAKCAARIGQAFSDTFTSIDIPKSYLSGLEDVERNGRTFSDGVGTISPSMMYTIWDEYAIRAKLKPTVFQIRLAGAKGMLSLDSKLVGSCVKLRKSMIKFQGTEDLKIEICGSGIRALPMFLNRQLIKILEDLGVPAHFLLEIQQEEVNSLRAIAQSPILAANFLERSNLAQSTKMPFLIRTLVRLKVDFLCDDFLRRMTELAVLVKVRELKYRSRIRVNLGVTLYGIMDETGILSEGEVYCPFVNERGQRQVLVGNDVIVTRAPALHPGDVQLVNAIDVPTDSPLHDIHNCIVFSQKGDRDLPSKLSGGDLDGDLYSIIYDVRLCRNNLQRPLGVAIPADYPRVQPPALDRAVEREDIINHFLTFMQQDQLGRIATLHQNLADQRPSGTLDADCLTLAELHSTAVDFSKTGIPADISLIPRSLRIRPDFMAPGPRVIIEDKLQLMMESPFPFEEDQDEDEDTAPRIRYYKSEKVIGQLYRAIDEDAFFKELQNISLMSLSPSRPDIFKTLWLYVGRETAGFLWDHHLDEAKEIKEIYEDNLLDLMYQYSSTPWSSSLDELEVFIGNIVGKNHGISRRQREASSSMREDYDALVEYTVAQIQNKEAQREESLERSIACFSLGLHEELEARVHHGKQAKPKLLSFRWIAATVCLQEVERLQKSR